MSEFENENNFQEEEDEGIIILTDADGTETPYEFLDLIEYKGQEYVVLLPVQDGEDDGMVVILEVHEIDEENEEYESIEDEAVLDAVYDIFKERYKDEFNFED